MLTHQLCLMLLFTTGFCQGIYIVLKKENSAIKNRKTSIWAILLLGLSLISLSTLADFVAHSIRPDVCIFGIASCFFTLIFYFFTVNNINYLIEQKEDHVDFKLGTWKSAQDFWLRLPLIIVVFVIPLDFFIQDHYYYHMNGQFPQTIAHNNLWLGTDFTIGTFTGLWITNFLYQISKETIQAIAAISKWLIMVMIGGAFIFQITITLRFNFWTNDLTVLKYVSQFTLIIMAFHLLYLVVNPAKHLEEMNAG